MRFWKFMDTFGSFRTFRRVVTCHNWAFSDAVAFPSSLQICFDYSVKISHKCDETSLTVTRITVSLTVK